MAKEYVKRGYFGLNGGFERMAIFGYVPVEEEERVKYHYHDKVMWCPKCGKMEKVTEYIVKDYQGKTKRYPDFDFELMKCPNCNHDITLSELLPSYDFHSSSHDSILELRNRQLENYNIYDEGDKIAISIFYRTYLGNVKSQKIAVKKYNLRIVINTKTGQSYLFPDVETVSRKRPKWASKRQSQAKIQNVTYTHDFRFKSDILDIVDKYPNFVKDVMDVIIDKVGTEEDKTAFIEMYDKMLEESLTKSSGRFEFRQRYSGNSWRLIDIFLYNKYHDLGFNFILLAKALTGLNDFYCKKGTRALSMFNGISFSNFIPTVESYLKIKLPKSLKRKIVSDPVCIYTLKLWVKCGFKDVNNLTALINSDILRMKKYNNTMKSTDCLCNDLFNYIKDNGFTSFVKYLIKYRGENVAKNLLLTINIKLAEDAFVDITRMFKKYKENGFITRELFKGNLIEIHNNMAKNYDQIKFKKHDIPYCESEMSFEGDFGGYSFKLPHDTYELVQIGKEMGICVGGYGDSALNKNCTIVTMKDGDKYVGCLELRKVTNINNEEEWQLYQAKAKFNNMLQEKKAEALKSWVEKLQIDTNECYDYRHIANGEIMYDDDKIYQNTHNWAINFQTYREIQPLDAPPRQRQEWVVEDDDPFW